MKVCHVIAGLPEKSGGPTQVLLGLTRALKKNGIETSAFTTEVDVGGTLSTEVLENQRKSEKSLDIRHFGIKGPWWYAYSPDLEQALEREAVRYDIFHVHGLWMYPTSMAMSVARRHGIPYVLTAHGALNEWAMKRSRWKKRFLLALWEGRNIQASGAVHFFNAAEEISPSVERFLSRKVFIPNGIDPDSLEPKPARGLFRARFNLDDKKVTLFLGRLHPVKGLDRLIEAFRDVAQKRKDAVLVIAGPDSEGYQAFLERMIADAGLSGRVILPGMLNEMEKQTALVDADLLVLPSHQEGHSMAVTEALYYGIPVIISKGCHMPEVATHKAGVIVENQPYELSNSILALLDDSGMRKEMGEAGRALVEERYTWDGIAREMIQVYRNLMVHPS